MQFGTFGGIGSFGRFGAGGDGDFKFTEKGFSSLVGGVTDLASSITTGVTNVKQARINADAMYAQNQTALKIAQLGVKQAKVQARGTTSLPTSAVVMDGGGYGPTMEASIVPSWALPAVLGLTLAGAAWYYRKDIAAALGR